VTVTELASVATSEVSRKVVSLGMKTVVKRLCYVAISYPTANIAVF